MLSSSDTGEFDVGPGFGSVSAYGDWERVGSLSDNTDFNSLPLKLQGVSQADTLRVILSGFKRGTTISTDRSAYDEIQVSTYRFPSTITAKVRQVSDNGLKSPIISCDIT